MNICYLLPLISKQTFYIKPMGESGPYAIQKGELAVGATTHPLKMIKKQNF